MDQEKIGKLIAKLRKEQGLTQSELGAKVNVGFKAVSKWERGITCPDISIINELSKILGITSDELLTGELNKENREKYKNKRPKNNTNKLLLIIPILLIILAICLYPIIERNKTYVYDLTSTTDDVYIEGEVRFKGKEMTILINKLKFDNNQLNKTIIKNYEYKILSNNFVIINFGFIDTHEMLSSEISINEFAQTFFINYNTLTKETRKNILKKGMLLKITFLDIENNRLEKELEIKIVK